MGGGEGRRQEPQGSPQLQAHTAEAPRASKPVQDRVLSQLTMQFEVPPAFQFRNVYALLQRHGRMLGVKCLETSPPMVSIANIDLATDHGLRK